MKIPSIIPTDKTTVKDLEGFLRNVTEVLNGRWLIGEQSAELVRFRWNSAAAPMVVPLRSTQKPAGVVCIAAQVPGSPYVLGGFLVIWRWTPTKTGGAITIDALGTNAVLSGGIPSGLGIAIDSGAAVVELTANTDYDVTLWVVGG